MEELLIKRALISVTNKTGIVEFAQFLANNGVELVSTGGTEKLLKESGLPVKKVSEFTGFPEILGCRVKTLHPNIHGGILADKDNPEHMATLEEFGILPFDCLCVNLYNFDKAAQDGLKLKDAVEQIDIGGPCMLRAAAKNYHSVLVIPGPEHYAPVKEALLANGMKAPLDMRRKLAAITFDETSDYDRTISDYLAFPEEE